RFFHLNNDPEVRHIQQLSDRLLTTRDMHQFLESLLIATCEYLRTPSAFVAAITAEGAKLEVAVGPLVSSHTLQSKSWRDLTLPADDGNGHPDLQTIGDFVVWVDYWSLSLYNREVDGVVGHSGVQGCGVVPELELGQCMDFGLLVQRAGEALDGRRLRQEVFVDVDLLLAKRTRL